jgi:NAD-dependent deacetylase sirtuin 5
VVWFGEILLHLGAISKIINETDLALVIGTSSTVWYIFFFISVMIYSQVVQVYPAARYASKVAQHGASIVAVFNIQRSQGDEDADFLFIGPCEDTLPRALFGQR